MNKAGIDGHAVAGICGLLAGAWVTEWSQIAGMVATSATGVYMIFRCYREWKKIKSGK